MAVARLPLDSHSDSTARLSDEIELYQRTYTTLLRSSGETHLRVLEPSHRAIGSSLHPLAASDEIDLGAFIYAIRRLPAGIVGARLVAMAQEVEAFVGAGMPVQTWQEAEAAARRRRWYDDGMGTLAVLLASASDVDDLLPTLVAFQIEWNKIRVRQVATAGARDRARQRGAFVETRDEDDILRQELSAFREGRTEGSWENFLYFVARIYFAVKGPAGKAERRAAEQSFGVTHMRSTTGLRVPAQILPLGPLDPGALDPRVGDVD